MKDEQIKQEELKAFALEDEALEGVAGGGKWAPNTKKTTISSSGTDATE